MKLYKTTVKFKRPRAARDIGLEERGVRSTGLDVIVHAHSISAAVSHLTKKFPGCEITPPIDLGKEPKHFVIAEVVA